LWLRRSGARWKFAQDSLRDIGKMFVVMDKSVRLGPPEKGRGDGKKPSLL
jgi:hypothetical protein